MKDEPKVHWAGGIKHAGGEFLAGWPCCCSGHRAERLWEQGRCTTIEGIVTCKRCLDMLARRVP